MESNSVLQDPEESCSHCHLFDIVSSKWEILEVIIAGVQAEAVLSQLCFASVSVSMAHSKLS